MAKNGFAVTISAQDAATETIKKINKSLEALVKPVTGANAAFDKLGKNTALGKLTKSLEGVSDRAADVVEKLGVLGNSGNALTAGGTIGGIAMMARQWADTGQALANTARRMGVSSGYVAKIQSMARLAGVSDQAATASAENMARNIGDALSGRNPEMHAYLGSLGIRTQYKADGSPDIEAAYADLQKALARAGSVGGRNKIMDILGQDEDFRAVVEHFDELNRTVAKLRPNAQSAADSGNDLAKELNKIGENMRGISDNIETALSPGLVKVLGLFDKLTAKIDDLTRSGTGQKVAAIAAGAGTGAVGGALTGAAQGALVGASKGWYGALAGAFMGALKGGAVGGLLGGASSYGLELLGGGGAKDIRSLEMPGLRWNNPGNIMSSGGGPKTYLTAGRGLLAMSENLLSYPGKYGVNTISGIIDKWSDPNDPRNNNAAYKQDVAQQTGFGLDQPLNLNDPTTASSLMAAMIKHEKGVQPFTPEQLAQALAQALKEVGPVQVNVNAPAGTTATAHSAQQFWPVKMNYGPLSGAVTP